jgi:hypothetical protein
MCNVISCQQVHCTLISTSAVALLIGLFQSTQQPDKVRVHMFGKFSQIGARVLKYSIKNVLSIRSPTNLHIVCHRELETGRRHLDDDNCRGLCHDGFPAVKRNFGFGQPRF